MVQFHCAQVILDMSSCMIDLHTMDVCGTDTSVESHKDMNGNITLKSCKHKQGINHTHTPLLPYTTHTHTHTHTSSSSHTTHTHTHLFFLTLVVTRLACGSRLERIVDVCSLNFCSKVCRRPSKFPISE